MPSSPLPAKLAAEAYAYFHEHGAWPLVRTLQASYGPRVSVRALAAEAGRENIVCQDGADGVCMLRLPQLEKLPEAASDLELLARAVSYIARRFQDVGPATITHTELGDHLGLDPLQLRRLGGLLYQTSRFWTAASWAPDNSSFSLTPSEDVFFFRDVETYSDFRQARATTEQADRRITAVLADEYRRARGEAVDSQTALPTRYRLNDEALDALLQRDLDELANVHALGAWKATAILAGACLETLLLDVCMRRDEECRSKWGKKWPGGVNASELVNQAKGRGWISKDHGDLASVIRRWRNIVHPHTALLADEPTKVLADALVAVLRLLIADLSKMDVGQDVG